MSDSNYLALIEEARDALVAKDGLIEKLSAALEMKNRDAELGAAIVAAGRWFDVAETAKELAVELAPGKRVGPNQLYAFLRNTSMVMKRRDPSSGWFYHQPKQDQVDAGRMKLQECVDERRRTPDGGAAVYRKTLVSTSGLVYLSKRIAEAAAAGALDDLVSE